jgi:hypothetical protein
LLSDDVILMSQKDDLPCEWASSTGMPPSMISMITLPLVRFDNLQHQIQNFGSGWKEWLSMTFWNLPT